MKYLFYLSFSIGLFIFCLSCKENSDEMTDPIITFEGAFFVTEIFTECIIDNTIGFPTAKRELVLKFNKSIDASSLKIGENVLLNPPINPSDTLYFSSDSTECRIPLCKSAGLPDSPVNCYVGTDSFIVTLTDGIRSLLGQQLDGNDDGEDGGNGNYKVLLSELCGPFQVDTVWHERYVEPNFFVCTSRLHIKFNKPIDEENFVEEGNFLINPVVPYLIKKDSPYSIYVKYCDSYNGGCQQVDAIITMITESLHGSLPRVKSTEGQLLDGDSDGIDGGDFVYNIEIGCY